MGSAFSSSSFDQGEQHERNNNRKAILGKATNMTTPRLRTLAATIRHSAFGWEDRREAVSVSPTEPCFSVALSRETGAGGGDIAQAVGRGLGWPVYDHDLLEQIALDIGVKPDLLESVDERRGNWMLQVFERLLGVPFVAESVYVHRLAKVMRALGARGRCVIVGRGSVFALPSSSTLRVRVVAPLDYRITVLRQRLAIDEATARRKILTLDAERTDFVRKHFNHDPESPENFDLVLNAARFSINECAELIIDGLHHMQARSASFDRRIEVHSSAPSLLPLGGRHEYSKRTG